MHTTIRCILTPLLLVMMSVHLSAQDQEPAVELVKPKERFSITFGAAAANFAPDISNFNTVYSNRSISRVYFAGIGTNRYYLIAKYKDYFASGRSVVMNIDVMGKAEWKQRFYAAGIRLRSDDHPLFADILYVVSRAEESITTEDPKVERLTLRYETEVRGMGFAVGVAVKVLGPIRLFVEGEYTIMMRKGRNQEGKADPELGGPCVSAGAHFAL